MRQIDNLKESSAASLWYDSRTRTSNASHLITSALGYDVPHEYMLHVLFMQRCFRDCPAGRWWSSRLSATEAAGSAASYDTQSHAVPSMHLCSSHIQRYVSSHLHSDMIMHTCTLHAITLPAGQIGAMVVQPLANHYRVLAFQQTGILHLTSIVTSHHIFTGIGCNTYTSVLYTQQQYFA